MSRKLIIGFYVVIGALTLFLTVQRTVAGAWGRALISGALFGFCVWRLYQLFAEPSAPDR